MPMATSSLSRATWPMNSATTDGSGMTTKLGRKPIPPEKRKSRTLGPVRLDDAAYADLLEVKRLHGCTTDAQAVRYALRLATITPTPV